MQKQMGSVFVWGGKNTSSSSISIIFSVTADSAGSFTISPIEALVSGNKFKANPVTLKVGKGGGSAAQPAPTPHPAASGSAPPPPDEAEEAEEAFSGARSRFDIGLVIAAGMTIGTLFTLFVTPVVYTFIARDHRAHEAKRAAREGGSPEPAPTPAG